MCKYSISHAWYTILLVTLAQSILARRLVLTEMHATHWMTPHPGLMELWYTVLYCIHVLYMYSTACIDSTLYIHCTCTLYIHCTCTLYIHCTCTLYVQYNTYSVVWCTCTGVWICSLHLTPPQTGRSRGFAFVYFEDVNDAIEVWVYIHVHVHVHVQYVYIW